MTSTATERSAPRATWAGSFTALVTPFKNGSVDYSKVRDLVERQVKGGTKGIVASGTTGESPTLTLEEKTELFDIVVKTVKGHIPVLAGVGSNDTSAMVGLARAANRVGVDGLMVVAPYYNRPSQRGLIAHFGKLAESVDLPVMLYNIPSRTAVNIDPETVKALVDRYPTIVGIKESVSDLEQVSQVIRLCGPACVVMAGEDALTLPMMALGAKGVVSTTSNVVPQDFSELCEACAEQDGERARAAHLKLLPLIKAMFVDTNPVPLKTAMAMLGLMGEDVRLPLVGLEDGNREKVREALVAYGLMSGVAKSKSPSRG